VEIVTDRIARFTTDGIALEGGDSLKADIVVTATGLVVKLLGGMAIAVDGQPIRIADHLSYKGAMLSDVPNLAVSFGYTNASWTLKSDLTARWVCRLLNRMDRAGAAVATPVLGDTAIERKPMLDFSSGYVQRAQPHMPKQGTAAPWKVHQNYPRDVLALRFGKLDDGVLRFARLTPAQDRAT
jgi:monooxygenase